MPYLFLLGDNFQVNCRMSDIFLPCRFVLFFCLRVCTNGLNNRLAANGGEGATVIG